MKSNFSKNQNSNIFKDIQNIKDNTDIADINQSDLLIFLQFYFTSAQKNLSKILSEKIIMNDSELNKITSSFNFWLNFSLNFKDDSFVNLLLNKNDEKAERTEFCRKKIIDIVKIIVNFLYNNLNSEEAFNKILKNNHHKLYELILKLKDIMDNIYNSKLRDEIFININHEKQSPIKKEESNSELKIPKLAQNFSEDNQFNNKDILDKEKITNRILNNIINNNDKEALESKNEFNELPNINDDNIKIENKLKNEESNINISNNNISDNNISNNNISDNIISNIQEENIKENDLSNNNNSENNIFPYKVDYPSLDYVEINKLFYNFCYFTKFNLLYFQVVFYEKIGYSFVDYNGDFIWADEYSTNILFEEENIKKLNLFNIMTDFSKYILKKKYKDNFFDYKDENNRIRVFTYTINGNKNKEQENNKKGEKLFDDLCNIKTLVSRASPVLLKIKEGFYIACILLETKFSLIRQNFDFFYWKSDWNNK